MPWRWNVGISSLEVVTPSMFCITFVKLWTLGKLLDVLQWTKEGPVTLWGLFLSWERPNTEPEQSRVQTWNHPKHVDEQTLPIFRCSVMTLHCFQSNLQNMEYAWEEKSNYFTISFVCACVFFFLRGNTPTDVVLFLKAFISKIPKSKLQAFFFTWTFLLLRVIHVRIFIMLNC